MMLHKIYDNNWIAISRNMQHTAEETKERFEFLTGDETETEELLIPTQAGLEVIITCCVFKNRHKHTWKQKKWDLIFFFRNQIY